MEWNLLYPDQRQFGGLSNYASALSSGDLWPSIVAPVLITVLSVVLSIVLGMIFAVLLDRPFRGQALARTLMITPFLIMPAAAALIWKYSILDADSGISAAQVSAFEALGVKVLVSPLPLKRAM